MTGLRARAARLRCFASKDYAPLVARSYAECEGSGDTLRQLQTSRVLPRLSRCASALVGQDAVTGLHGVQCKRHRCGVAERDRNHPSFGRSTLHEIVRYETREARFGKTYEINSIDAMHETD